MPSVRHLYVLFSGIIPAMALVLACLAQTADAATPGPGWEALVEHADSSDDAFHGKAARFLAEHAPPRDADLSPEFLIEQFSLAMESRGAHPWSDAVPESVFLNDVLPYAVFDETREPWRAEMRERAARIIGDAATITDAAQRLNAGLFNDVNVHYNTGRKAPNQSPAESMAQGRATCTGLSILLIDACRSVGIPARAAGVANWTGRNGNHTWVEIWDDGWHYTGADEYNAAGLNRGWFSGAASKAIVGDREHAVWATSWIRRDSFPMVWAPDDTTVGAVEVTTRYQPANEESAPAPTKAITQFVRFVDADGQRRVATVSLLSDKGLPRQTVRTRAGTSDLNDMPELTFPAAGNYTIEVTSLGEVLIYDVSIQEAGTLDLAHQDGHASVIDRATAESTLTQLTEHLRAISGGNDESIASVTNGKHTLRWLERTFGDAPAGERITLDFRCTAEAAPRPK